MDEMWTYLGERELNAVNDRVCDYCGDTIKAWKWTKPIKLSVPLRLRDAPDQRVAYKVRTIGWVCARHRWIAKSWRPDQPDGDGVLLKSLLAVQSVGDKNLPSVRDLRRRLGLTQEQLARRLGYSVGTVRDWERGRYQPRPHVLALILAMEASE